MIRKIEQHKKKIKLLKQYTLTFIPSTHNFFFSKTIHKMATSESARERDLLSIELNKLNKKLIVDILVNKRVPEEVASEVVKQYFSELFSVDNSSFTHGDESHQLRLLESQSVSLKSELKTLHKLNYHLERRISNLEDIISLLKSGNSNVESSSDRNVNNNMHSEQYVPPVPGTDDKSPSVAGKPERDYDTRVQVQEHNIDGTCREESSSARAGREYNRKGSRVTGVFPGNPLNVPIMVQIQ